MLCEKCLYRKNCQFLLKHKKTVVEDCSAFESENKIKAEAIKEFAEMITNRASAIQVGNISWVWQISQDDIDNLVKEMVGEQK